MKKTVDEVFEEMIKLFDPDLTRFKQDVLRGKVIYALEYPDKELKIVATAPIIYKMNDNYEREKRLHVKFAVHYQGGQCLEFEDSRIVDGWENVAKEKIDTLVRLVELGRICPTCDVQMYPEEDSAKQGKPGPTHFVWHKCPKCKINLETQWGLNRLKTQVARFLKKHKR